MESVIDSNMHGKYDELAKLALEKLVELHAQEECTDKQLWIAIAGGPGAGKSTLTAEVVSRINEIYGSEIAVMIGMDGFHYSRAELRTLSENGLYSFDELLARRGSPWTFDAEALIRCLSIAKQSCQGTFPRYDRVLSDPVADGVELRSSHRIVMVEGNYLLNFDDSAWSPLRDIFDIKWFVCCRSMAEQRRRLVLRHLETWTEEKTRVWGAAGEEGAGRKADGNDVINAEYVTNYSRKYADLIIESF